MLKYSEEDILKIEGILRENSVFSALLTGDLYSFEEHFCAEGLSNYKALLDRNIYTRLAQISSGEKVCGNDEKSIRCAAAVLAFFQITGTSLFTYSSLHEYADTETVEKAAEQYQLIGLIDNCNPQSLIDIAIGRSSRLDVSDCDLDAAKCYKPDYKVLEMELIPHKLHYLNALKIINLSLKSDDGYSNLMSLLDWMESDFIISSGPVLFSSLLFSPNRIKKMLKDRSLKAARNIAWDFHLITLWQKLALEGLKSSEPVFLASGDKIIHYIARKIGISNDQGSLENLVGDWAFNSEKQKALHGRMIELDEAVAKGRDVKSRLPDGKIDSMISGLEIEHHKLSGS